MLAFLYTRAASLHSQGTVQLGPGPRQRLLGLSCSFWQKGWD